MGSWCLVCVKRKHPKSCCVLKERIQENSQNGSSTEPLTIKSRPRYEDGYSQERKNKTLQIGDKVNCIPAIRDIRNPAGTKEENHAIPATVIYIHPKGRFIVVRYDSGLTETVPASDLDVQVFKVDSTVYTLQSGI